MPPHPKCDMLFPFPSIVRVFLSQSVILVPVPFLNTPSNKTTYSCSAAWECSFNFGLCLEKLLFPPGVIPPKPQGNSCRPPYMLASALAAPPSVLFCSHTECTFQLVLVPHAKIKVEFSKFLEKVRPS